VPAGASLHQQSSFGIESAVAQYLVERPIVEKLDQLGIGDFQRGLVIRK